MEYLITIFDSHDDNGETFESEFTTVGTFEGDADSYTLSYTEKDRELGGCVTTVSVTGGSKILMSRTGAFNTEIILEKGRRHTSVYSTPFGDMTMGFNAREIKSSMTSRGGVLSFAYSIDFSAGMTTENKLKITVKEIQ